MHDAVDDLALDMRDELGRLEPIDVVVRFLNARGSGENHMSFVDLLSAVSSTADDLTIETLFEWSSCHHDDSRLVVAAKKVVCTAVYRAVLLGRGCPSCGFSHDGEGRYRELTLREMVMDGVIDDDPFEFLGL
jgi:hypothetical protein